MTACSDACVLVAAAMERTEIVVRTTNKAARRSFMGPSLPHAPNGSFMGTISCDPVTAVGRRRSSAFVTHRVAHDVGAQGRFVKYWPTGIRCRHRHRWIRRALWRHARRRASRCVCLQSHSQSSARPRHCAQRLMVKVPHTDLDTEHTTEGRLGVLRGARHRRTRHHHRRSRHAALATAGYRLPLESGGANKERSRYPSVAIR